MKLIEKTDQMRRDCWITIKCESCGEIEKDVSAYDDRDFWDNVLPDMKCEKCGKSTFDMGLNKQPVATRYSDFEQV